MVGAATVQLAELSTLPDRQAHEVLLAQGRAIIQNSETLYVDFDVESDGKPGYGSLLALGGVTPGGSKFYREIKPDSDLFVPEQQEFCESHRLERARLLREGQPVEDAIKDFHQWVRKESGDRRVAGVALNASFDSPWVDLASLKAGTPNTLGSAGYCIKSLAMSFGLLQVPKARLSSMHPYEWKQTTKSNLPKMLVPDREFTHVADEDSIWQQEAHCAMVGLLSLIGNEVADKYR